MSATLQRPDTSATRSPAARDARHEPRATRSREDMIMLATLALLIAACLPLARVYVGLAFFRPVIGSVLLAVGLSWGARRLGAGPFSALGIVVAGWIAFVSAAFLRDTLAGGVLPTGASIGAAATLWARGIELMQLRPAPAFAEAGMMFITLTGIWAVAHAVEGLVFRLGAPVRAILMSLVLWVVPLAVAPPSDRAWAWTIPFLAAAAALLLSFAGADLRRWGAWVPAGRPGYGSTEPTLLPAGGVLASLAILVGVVLAGALPGFGDAPWYEVRGVGGTTLTTNPIVDIRARLVAQDSGPVMRVTADRPVYLRTTALDVYSQAEEWTNAGIRGAPVDGSFPPEVALGPVERVNLEVEVVDLPRAVLVPAPYQTLSVDGPIADAFQYDRTSSTVTLDAGATLQQGDMYRLVAAIPSPTPEQLDAADVTASPRLTQLPDNVPAEVRQLAAEIVRRADARTPFQRALAVQRELRSWDYSHEPPPGHGGQAMLAFISNKIGYCEQYAGTMAVMLRSLGVPARVAVGYTPGELVDPDSSAYIITNAHAHSWVEVLFDGLGWVAFEPTPRSDGNVLVPTASNIAPSRTAAQLGDGEDGAGFEANDPAQDVPPAPAPANPQVPGPQAGADGDAGAQGDGRRVAVWILLALLGGVAVVAVVGAVSGHRDLPGRTPLARVMHARAEVEQLGRGVGLPPAPWETDREFLSRVAHRHSRLARDAADVLATQVGRARYALQLSAESAATAERAAATLGTELLRDAGVLRRGVIRLRGRTSRLLARVRAEVAQRSSSLRRRAPSR